MTDLPENTMTRMDLAKRRVRAKRALRRACAKGRDPRQWAKVVLNIVMLNNSREKEAVEEIGKILAATLIGK